MITRIVKMVFQEDKTDIFKEFSKTIVNKIASSKGCHKVNILQDKNNKNTFFSYSLWDSEDDLNNYRSSELFIDIWSKTKVMFADKPLAWSTEIVTKSQS